MRRAVTAAVALSLVVAGCSSEDSAGPANSAPTPIESTTTAAAPTTTAAAPTTTAASSTTGAVEVAPSFPDGDRWTVEVIARYPHDPEAFTQGLLVRDDVIYESTGLYGMSSVRTVSRTTGEVVAEAPLPDDLFGEGLELVGDRLLQLTWQEETALVWDAASLEQVDAFAYEGEGWGLCHDGEQLVMSDGTDELEMRSPADFEVIETLSVVRDGEPVTRLNELECVGGLVLANVWQTDEIVVIDPDSGQVVATIDAASLVEEVGATGDPRSVLNGIAYDQVRDTFLLTGKLWPTTFEVRFVDASGNTAASNTEVEVAEPIAARLETRTVEVAGVERTYRLFTPEIDGSTGPPALVVDLHGFTSNPDRHDSVSQLRSLAAAEGFVVAQPTGIGSIPSWDPSADGRSGADDVEFVRTVVADVQQELSIDRRRIFAMGFSNGGGMAHRLACDASDVFAGIGTVSGAYVDAGVCDATHPVAVASFHGTRDLVVPYEGAGQVFVNVPEWAADWADRNGCAVGPVRQDLFDDVYADAWSDCSDAADVVLFTIVDGLHSWPGSPDGGLFRSTESIFATGVLWDFFQSHARTG